MPRDDLTIDFNRGGRMPPIEHQDAAAVIDEWTNRAANLNQEIQYMQDEIGEHDRRMQDCLAIINKHDAAIQKWIRINGSHTTNPKEEQLTRVIIENYDKAQIIQEKKMALAEKTQRLMEKHTLMLDTQIKELGDRGELTLEPDFPSLFKDPKALERTPSIRAEPTAMPLSQIHNSAAPVHTRHPNQYPQRPPINVQVRQASGSAAHSPIPNSPAAPILMNRQAREASQGAANKRQRLNSGLGSLPPSGLARHTSMTPGTPRAGTPSGARAGSAGPRLTQKNATTKKVAPYGSRQSGVPRKGKPGKSSLSRLKRAGNKNSPTSTNDSELSDAESGSGDEDDEAVTPPAGRNGDGDEEMLDGDEEDGADDRKYCTCQSVSYGDMVACDNEQCPYEWFHWSCVGLKSEPVGTWICPPCTLKMKK
ncbi:hypothetical protein BJ875DRAFT_451372 [Amylocarpus encephaloides]|uniref:Chromatin modification-related protein n=1 Tax=Amylocarpus encephaloides TaxID=45428 RepID=A0A9P7YSN2_9HELO|nr:hypothetical protein BJ875DRAFT_451372 [Amylocarpus encephaloides]